MTFALIFVITAVASVVLAGVLRKAPWLFYAAAVAAVVVMIAGFAGVIDGGWWKPLILLVRRCMVALALFAVVMFVGVLPSDSKLGIRLRSVRTELSILACILCVGHVALYVAPYAARAFAGNVDAFMAVSLTTAAILLVLLAVLGVTSLGFVKKAMRTANWKKIQRWSYVFFGLTYVHLMCMLAPAAIAGGGSAIVGVVVYTVLFGGYAIGRIARWRIDSAKVAQEG